MVSHSSHVTLHLLCGKAASGKSTLAKKLLDGSETILISEDEWLSALFGPDMKTLTDYVTYSKRLETALEPHIIAVLTSGVSMVMDFQANTIERRVWLKSLADQAGVAHKLHYLKLSDEICKARLRKRNASGDHQFTLTDEQFDQLAKHFVAPTKGEGLEMVVYQE